MDFVDLMNEFTLCTGYHPQPTINFMLYLLCVVVYHYYRAGNWKDYVPVTETCKACAKHAHIPRPRVRTRLHDFRLVELSHQPVPVQ